MSSITDPQPENSAAEELVAYLDGELSPDDCRRIEERLAADESYRQQLRELDQAWNALDSLPSSKVNDDFARTTMELVTVVAHADATVATAHGATSQRRRNTWFALAALAGSLLGFVTAWLLLPNQNLALLQDLPVIQQVDVLQQVESIDFIRRLADVVPREQLVTDEAALDEELQALKTVSAASISVRRQWVQALPADEKVILAAEHVRFKDLKPEEQTRLRTLEQDTAAAGDDTQRTMLAYGQWLNQLTAAEKGQLRSELRGQSVDDQARTVRRLVRQQRDQVTRRLSADDAKQIREVLKQIAEERKGELANLRQRGGNGPNQRFEGMRGALPLVARESYENKLWQRIAEGLSPEAKSHLDSLPERARTWQLWRWVWEAIQVNVDSNDLERFFSEKLGNEDRERFLELSTPEMKAGLERLYFATEFGDMEPSQWREGFREWMRGPQSRSGFRRDGPRGDRGRPDGRPGGPPGGSPPNFGEDGRRPPLPGPGGPPPGPPPDRGFPGDRTPREGFGPDGPRPGERRPNGPPPREEQNEPIKAI